MGEEGWVGGAATDDELAVTPPSLGDEGNEGCEDWVGSPLADDAPPVAVGSTGYGSAVMEEFPEGPDVAPALGEAHSDL